MRSLLSAVLAFVAVVSNLDHPTVASAASISVSIARPVPDHPSGGDQLQVAAVVQSDFQLTTVRANVLGRSADLVFSQSAYCDQSQFSLPFCHPGWIGTVDLSGLPSGPMTVTVTATDAFGNSADASSRFFLDRHPVLTVTSPLDLTVARPSLSLKITCVDDSPQGCISLTAKVDTTVVATGTSTIDETISLDGYDGRVVDLQIQARDAAGQTTTQVRAIYVDSSPRLTELVSVDGAILDVTPDRILFLDRSNGLALKIHSRVTGQDGSVPGISGKTPQYGFLTPSGAIYLAQGQDVTTAGVYDWRGSGPPISLGLANATTSFAVRGNFAIWSGERGDKYTGQVILFRRDLASGTNVEILDHGVGNTDNDVSESGDVVFWTSGDSSDYNIFRYRGGTITRLTNDTQLWNTYPITDGTNVVYRKHTRCCGAQTYATVMYGALGEVTLVPPQTHEPRPQVDYAAKNGWIAFTRPDLSGQLQVWERSPSGNNTQLSFFSSTSQIDALNPLGEVMFTHAMKRYLASPTLPATQTNSALGMSLWQDGQWLVAIGRSLFKVCSASTGGVLLSGRVSDAAGAGIEGVSILLDGASSSNTTVTDATGQYHVCVSASVQHTLTPTAPGVTFTPGTRNVIVGTQDVSGLDFTGRGGGMSASASLNEVTFSTGQMLQVALGATNPGSTVAVDMYVGAFLPDGDGVVLLTSTGTFAFGSLTNVGAWLPYQTGLQIGPSLPLSAPDFFSYQWGGGEPQGNYVLFLLLIRAGAPPALSGDQVLGRVTTGFSFH